VKLPEENKIDEKFAEDFGKIRNRRQVQTS
jgi:hypothetical protein